jgi:hypothetical protein
MDRFCVLRFARGKDRVARLGLFCCHCGRHADLSGRCIYEHDLLYWQEAAYGPGRVKGVIAEDNEDSDKQGRV